jgi:hypothetical protein
VPTIEQRVSELEAKVSQLMGGACANEPTKAWWEYWYGAFANDPSFDEAVRLGAEYRMSQPNAADAPDALTA